MKTSSPLLIIFCLTTALLTSCAARPIEITSFPSTLKLNGIEVEFSGYKVDDRFLTIDICFDPPSDGVWFAGDTALKIENQKLLDGGVSRLPENIRPGGYECQTLHYYLNDSVIPLGKAELSIGRLDTSTNDDDIWDCNTAQKNLYEDKTGIVVTCDPTIVGHPGFKILEKPATMSNDEASRLAEDAFSYTDAVRLNWRFSFLIEKQ
jgi:hypothetical protein